MEAILSRHFVPSDMGYLCTNYSKFNDSIKSIIVSKLRGRVSRTLDDKADHELLVELFANKDFAQEHTFILDIITRTFDDKQLSDALKRHGTPEIAKVFTKKRVYHIEISNENNQILTVLKNNGRLEAFNENVEANEYTVSKIRRNTK